MAYHGYDKYNNTVDYMERYYHPATGQPITKFEYDRYNQQRFINYSELTESIETTSIGTLNTSVQIVLPDLTLENLKINNLLLLL